MLGLLFANASVDVIDAETSAHGSKWSKLTRLIAEEENLNLRVTAGFSPTDIPAAARSNAYNFVFVDGRHTEAQLFYDVRRVMDYLAPGAVVVLHDVDNAQLHLAVTAILERSPGW